MRLQACFNRTTAFILGFTILALAAALPIPTALASPITVTVDPNSGAVGSVITVSGGDASPNGELRVYLNDFFFMAATSANASGHYGVNITIPALPASDYYVVVVDTNTQDSGSADFTVQPMIVVDPEEGSYNDTVTVKGYGFRASGAITILFDGTDVTPLPKPWPDGFGSFQVSFQVPLTPGGNYVITADNGVNSASALFTVVPKITLSPQTSGPPSTLIMAIGTGFAPSVNVSLYFDQMNVTPRGGIVTWFDGSFGRLGVPAMFFIPNVPDGSYIINATDETGNSAVAPFIVPSPTITLTPDETYGSSIITVTGLGFPPRMPVLLYLEGALLTEFIDLVTQNPALSADDHGAYEYRFILPVSKPGVYTVTAYGVVGPELTVGEELASASLTVKENAMLVDVKDKIATIVIPDLGTIKTNLTAIDAELVSINGSTATINSTLGLIQADVTDILLSVTEINGSTATIQTTLGEMDGTITSIDGSTATIETDVGTVKADISSIKGTQEAFAAPLYVALILALVAAIGSIMLVVMHLRVMRKSGT